MPNRLVHETSPYLLQHANNPVDWYPWGGEAFALARDLDRPVFLSIGYSACHWCHVMEHESFEDDDIARLMNDWFVCIKVDREERPDLDSIYMTSVQLLTGHGGWPMSVFLTPAGQPFFGGTYWPPRARMRMPGFSDILRAVHQAWNNRRDDLLHQAADITSAIIQHESGQAEPSPLTEDLLRNAERDLLRAADRTEGGFGHAPKFPHPMDLRVLLRTARRFGNAEALEVLRLTLDKMAAGGIYDHLGGGFHRYSTDARWLVPHFEKMLYDNALLVPAYLEAWQAGLSSDYARVATETLDYVLREMTQPEGGFYATQDADSEGVEGKFFVWSQEEVLSLLGPQDGPLFCECFDVTPHGNWEEQSILNRPRPLEPIARAQGLSLTELDSVLARSRQKLLIARSQRIAPGRDDKILVNWNGLMISAMAQASFVLDSPRFAEAAERAAHFILTKMRSENGRLLHSFKDGQARFNGCLDDYSCLIQGLVDLFEATGRTCHLRAALILADQMRELFHDPERGGFFYTATDHEALITRSRDTQDNATPSGNGMAACALLRLGRLCSRPDLEEAAARTLEMLSGQMKRVSMASGQSLLALDFLLGPVHELVLFEGRDTEENALARSALRGSFQRQRLLIIRLADVVPEPDDALIEPHLAGRSAIDGRATLYICRQGTCQAPVIGGSAIISAVRSLD